VFLAGLLAVVVALGTVAHRRSGRWQVTSANFAFAGCATVTICPTDDVALLAHQAWVEITTRKAAIPFDEVHDVIAEIYDSWYELFGALRELSKNVPTRHGLREGGDASQLVEILTGALNEGLRPHLTQWQTRFRRWYEDELKKPETAGLAPQDIQQRYPQYDALVADLRGVNAGLAEFAESLRKLAHDRRKTGWWRSASYRPKNQSGEGN
jgi:hypothetical protein